MAHPLIEAIYLGLFASGVAQPVDVPIRPVTQKVVCSTCIAADTRAPHVLYNRAAGTRSVYIEAVHPPGVHNSPKVRITEWQDLRTAPITAG